MDIEKEETLEYIESDEFRAKLKHFCLAHLRGSDFYGRVLTITYDLEEREFDYYVRASTSTKLQLEESQIVIWQSQELDFSPKHYLHEAWIHGHLNGIREGTVSEEEGTEKEGLVEKFDELVESEDFKALAEFLAEETHFNLEQYVQESFKLDDFPWLLEEARKAVRERFKRGYQVATS